MSCSGNWAVPSFWFQVIYGVGMGTTRKVLAVFVFIAVAIVVLLLGNLLRNLLLGAEVIGVSGY